MTTAMKDLNTVIGCILNEDFSRKFDNCFENFHGNYVYSQLKPQIQRNIELAQKVLKNKRFFDEKLIQIAQQTILKQRTVQK